MFRRIHQWSVLGSFLCADMFSNNFHLFARYTTIHILFLLVLILLNCIFQRICLFHLNCPMCWYKFVHNVPIYHFDISSSYSIFPPFLPDIDNLYFLYPLLGIYYPYWTCLRTMAHSKVGCLIPNIRGFLDTLLPFWHNSVVVRKHALEDF